MHFTRLGAYEHERVPIIARGEGCYVWDQHGKRYLDGLSGLFVVQVGHGRQRAGRGRVPARPSSSPTSRSGTTPTRRRSSSPHAWRGSRLATSTASSSRPAAPKPWSRRGSWPASTSAPSASPHRTKVIAATSRTTARRWARSPSTASPRIRDAVRAAHAGRVPGAEHRPLPLPHVRGRARVHAGMRGRHRGHDRVRGPGHDRRRLSSSRCRMAVAPFPHPTATSHGCARSATATACCSCPTR